ncbi:MAG: extradiol dioxygenase family protein [Sphingobacteriales bacterium]|jgi:extradiol dioxygenase family protein
MKKIISPFHLAFPVKSLEVSRRYYTNVLGCTEGRSDSYWVDLNFFGHQVVLHQKEGFIPPNEHDVKSNPVDGHDVPIPHFGVVLPWEEWKDLKARLEADNTKFIIEPYNRFEGLPGEQATMFFEDPEGNALEFKAFKNMDNLFKS